MPLIFSTLLTGAAVFLGWKFTGTPKSVPISVTPVQTVDQSTSASKLFGWAAVIFAVTFLMHDAGKLLR